MGWCRRGDTSVGWLSRAGVSCPTPTPQVFLPRNMPPTVLSPHHPDHGVLTMRDGQQVAGGGAAAQS